MPQRKFIGEEISNESQALSRHMLRKGNNSQPIARACMGAGVLTLAAPGTTGEPVAIAGVVDVPGFALTSFVGGLRPAGQGFTFATAL